MNVIITIPFITTVIIIITLNIIRIIFYFQLRSLLINMIKIIMITIKVTIICSVIRIIVIIQHFILWPYVFQCQFSNFLNETQLSTE